MRVTDERVANRKDKNLLTQALKNAGAKFHGPNIQCPFHDDSRPSAGIFNHEDGGWRYKCNGCGAFGDYLDVSHMSAGGVIMESAEPQEDEKASKTWDSIDEIEGFINHIGELDQLYQYADPATGEIDLVVARFTEKGSKRFMQFSPDQDGKFAARMPKGKRLPLYNRSRLVKTKTVVVVEGEKCVHALSEVGIVATTSPMGAGKSGFADWSPLAGKRVILWPDADKMPEDGADAVGVAHMKEVAKHLANITPRPDVQWLDPYTLDLPEKGDAADLIEKLDGDDESEKKRFVATVLKSATKLTRTASEELRADMQNIAAGKKSLIPMPWTLLHKSTFAMMAGNVTVLCGDPSAAKSLMAYQMVSYWMEKGYEPSFLALEDDKPYHLRRTLAQKSGEIKLLDMDWLVKNSDSVDVLIDGNEEYLDKLGQCFYDSPDDQMTLTQVADWVEQRAKGGSKAIIVDPVTATLPGSQPWIDDLKFVMRIKGVARKYGCSVLLVIHPRKGKPGKGGSTMHDLSGGAAYSRFAQTVIWLEHHEPEKVVHIMDHPLGEPIEVRADRVLSIQKARNGPGTGLQIAYCVKGNHLNFKELGIVVAKPDAK